MPDDRDPRYAGLVHGYDRKPKRRLFELLKGQGLQANEELTFLVDGGEEVRALTELVIPEAEHVLDWFHTAMRLTMLEQYARGVAHHDEKEHACCASWSGPSGCFGMATSAGRSSMAAICAMT